MLFNIALEWVMRTTRETQKTEVGGVDMILFIYYYILLYDVVDLGNCNSKVM